MDALLRLVSVGGSACRNLAKHKVRQPLAEMRVAPLANEALIEALPSNALHRQLREELNVKAVSLHDVEKKDRCCHTTIKLNKKTAFPKLGAKV